MSEPAAESAAAEFDRRTVEEFRARGGQVGGVLEGTALILIHHVGARSGTEYVTFLACFADGDHYVIVGSNGGSFRSPAWCHNLRSSPVVIAELGDERCVMRAEEQFGPDRDEWWAKLTGAWRDLAAFAAKTERTIPVFVLRRVTE